MKAQCEDRTCMLRKAFLGNALFSTVSGLIILFAQRRVLGILGLSNRINLTMLGAALIIFAAMLVINAHRQQVKISDAWVGVLMDLGWVVGTVVAIFTVPFSTQGKWVVIGIADVVLLFAMLQFLGLRRIQKAGQLAR